MRRRRCDISGPWRAPKVSEQRGADGRVVGGGRRPAAAGIPAPRRSRSRVAASRGRCRRRRPRPTHGIQPARHSAPAPPSQLNHAALLAQRTSRARPGRLSRAARRQADAPARRRAAHLWIGRRWPRRSRPSGSRPAASRAARWTSTRCRSRASPAPRRSGSPPTPRRHGGARALGRERSAVLPRPGAAWCWSSGRTMLAALARLGPDGTAPARITAGVCSPAGPGGAGGAAPGAGRARPLGLAALGVGGAGAGQPGAGAGAPAAFRRRKRGARDARRDVPGGAVGQDPKRWRGGRRAAKRGECGVG